MSNTYNRRKGATFEQQVADFFTLLRTFGGEVFRAPKWGAKDKGDLTNTRDFAIEVKNCKTIDLAKFVDEATVEKHNAGRRWAAAVVKRRSKPVGSAYVVMQLDDFADLLRAVYPEEETSH